VFALLAVIVACLGLFGLSSYTVEQRTKEVGVRKVLGASLSSILGLLSTEYLKLILTAFIIAVPISYYGMSRWLEEFAYRTSFGVSEFLLAGALVLFVVLLSVGYQSVRAALANPVDALRYE
jgi:putative ABC transport system permease protein